MGGSFAGALRDEMLLCGKRIHMPHHSADGRISVVSVYFLASIASISTSAFKAATTSFPGQNLHKGAKVHQAGHAARIDFADLHFGRQPIIGRIPAAETAFLGA